jgi:TolB-like protein/cytochrome c-type biogenesis protein CcmH/NrfG
MGLMSELGRRNIFRIALAYLAAAWLALQVIDLILDAYSAPDWIMQAALLAAAAGFPLVLLFAWAFELTPEGIKRDSDIQRSPGEERKASRRLDRAIIVVLSVAVTLLLVDRVFLQSPEPSGADVAANTLAVLPFVALSSGQDDEYFADGISEVLIHQLSNVPGLVVTGRSSSFAFKGENVDVREIGRRLGVAAILEGSLQRSENKLRIAVQLVNAQTGTQYWSETFDRDGGDIFAVQDEIAGLVVESLPDTLVADEAASHSTGVGTTNLEAYDVYLQGLNQLRIGTVDSLPRAIQYFERALELDDDFNDARLKLLETYWAQLIIFQIDYAELMVRNQSIPREVLARDPNSAAAMSFLATADFSLHFPTGSGEAERLWQKALEIEPRNPDILAAYAYYLNWTDRFDEGMAALESALEVDPFSPRALAGAARHGDPAYAARLREVYPENPSGWAITGERGLRDGDLVRAFEYFTRAEEISPRDSEFPAFLAMILMTAGLLEEAEAAIRRAEVKGPSATVTVAARIAMTYLQDGIHAAGPMALGAIRSGLPPRQFSEIVLEALALRYALQVGAPGDFIEAVTRWQEVVGVGGARNLRDLDIASLMDYLLLMRTLPAFRAAGETDVVEQNLAQAQAYFEQASETARTHETPYELQLYSGDVDGALDTLEHLVDTGRGGIQPAWNIKPSEFRWWLEFQGILAAPLADEPRYTAILEKRKAHIAREREAIVELIAAGAGQSGD